MFVSFFLSESFNILFVSLSLNCILSIEKIKVQSFYTSTKRTFLESSTVDLLLWMSSASLGIGGYRSHRLALILTSGKSQLEGLCVCLKINWMFWIFHM